MPDAITHGQDCTTATISNFPDYDLHLGDCGSTHDCVICSSALAYIPGYYVYSLSKVTFPVLSVWLYCILRAILLKPAHSSKSKTIWVMRM